MMSNFGTAPGATKIMARATMRYIAANILRGFGGYMNHLAPTGG